MRKVKKINGYLVVKFNDRERREWPELGSYGVIDAELYTGTLEVDRGKMEYDSAESLEAAVALARGLDSEFDVEEPKVTITVVKETDDKTIEQGPVNPRLLIAGWESILRRQVESGHARDMDARAANHELHGYIRALYDLGIVEETDDRFQVAPDAFSSVGAPRPLPRSPEEFLSYICDEVCKERIPGRTQEELDAICAKCAVERLAAESDARELASREAAHRELNGIIGELRETRLCAAAERLEHEARAYLKALVTYGAVTEPEQISFDTAISDAAEHRLKPPMKETFEYLPPQIKRSREARKTYALGLMLEQDCPDNDCRVYLNTFHMAQELDDRGGEAVSGKKFYFKNTETEEVLVLPVTPQGYKITHGHKAVQVDMLGTGEANLPGEGTLLDEVIEGFFPAHDYPFNQPGAGSDPFAPLETLEKWSDQQVPVRFLVEGTPVNALCLLDPITYEEKDGTGDLYFRIPLRGYRILAGAETEQEDTGNDARSVETSPEHAASYTVQSGDTLWAIARRFYGDGSLCARLAAANNISNPNLIYAGQILTLPGVGSLPTAGGGTMTSQMAAKTKTTYNETGWALQLNTEDAKELYSPYQSLKSPLSAQLAQKGAER